MTDTSLEQYLVRKQIPQLLESLITGISYARPEDPIAFLQKGLDQLKADPTKTIKWDSLITEEESALRRRLHKQVPRAFYDRNPSDALLQHILGPKPELHAADTPKRLEPFRPLIDAHAVTTAPTPGDERMSNVVFVLGGPGSGKGTQCAKIVAEFGVSHLSVGDLMRAEVAKGTAEGNAIDKIMQAGQIVPLAITLEVVKNALNRINNPKGVLLDGYAEGEDKLKKVSKTFPREMAQATEFEKHIGKARFALYFECTTELLEQRLLKRGETSGRADDNAEAIKKRFKTFLDQSLPVVGYFEKQQRLVKVSSAQPIDDVYAEVRNHFL